MIEAERPHVVLRGLAGIAILAWVTYLIVALAGCAAIATAPACQPLGSATRHDGLRDRAEQVADAVAIAVECGDKTWTGSGVLVSPTQVVTASHVAHCDHDGAIVVRRLGTAMILQAVIELDEPDFDLARVRFVAGAHLDDVRAVAVGPRPKPGDVVCFAAGNPVPESVCGSVSDIGHDPRAELGHSATTIPGNSGSGVYDAAGRLVAIVTWHADQADIAESVYVGGRASLLDSSGVVP